MNKEFDVLIIGTGIAGLSCALKCAEKGLEVGIVTREKDPNITNTYWAQGGIIFSDPKRENETLLIEDILRASSNTSHLDAVKVLARESADILQEVLLNKVQTNFAKNTNGNLAFTREAAHSHDRILYQGDTTGREIQISLLNYLKDKKRFANIEILTSHTALDLITPSHHGVFINQRYETNKVVGAYVFDQEQIKVKKILAKRTVLATGGFGALYLHHSNAEGARGDGHAMAERAGAQLTNMEFIQFHPTTFYKRTTHRRFLISEALRGEGARLLNESGDAFMSRYHPDAEMAPRDIVARAISDEMIRTKNDNVYLDLSHKDPDWIKSRFPTIYHHCLENRINMAHDPIPVVPAAHYSCGGVKVDLNGQTTLQGLYAVGEVACTGVHGANRLASTSLLEGLTWGYRAGLAIAKEACSEELYPTQKLQDWRLGAEQLDMALISQDVQTLKQTMWNYVGLVRSRNRLYRAKALFEELQYQIGKFYKHAELHDELIGLHNRVQVALMVVNASTRSPRSIGCFYRQD